MTNQTFIDKKTGLVIGGAAASLALSATPSVAQDAGGGGVDDVSSMLTSVAGIAGTAVGIVVLAMGVRIAIKQVNRVMTKG